MSDIDRIKQKLAKLLKLGECSAATDGEISNALDIATQLMAKHQLTRDDIDMDAADPVARVKMGRHSAFCKSTKCTTWESILSRFVTDFIGSVESYLGSQMPVRRNGIAIDSFTTLKTGHQTRMAATVAFYGCDDDARCAVDLFEELRDTIATMAIVRWGGWAKGEGGAYAYGFAASLQQAQNESVKKLNNPEDSTTHALMIRKEEVQLAIVNRSVSWLKETHGINCSSGGKTVRKRKLTHDQAQAYYEGKRDGKNYDVNRPEARQRLA